ncbi:Aquaporin-9 [Turdus rufiventris]|nr:Aquaporin-9 [Turdus rufiventris]
MLFLWERGDKALGAAALTEYSSPTQDQIVAGRLPWRAKQSGRQVKVGEEKKQFSPDCLGDDTVANIYGWHCQYPYHSASGSRAQGTRAIEEAKMSRKSKRSLKEKFALKNRLAKEALSEFLGTFILITLGCGCVGQTVLSRGEHGGPMTVSVGFAMAVTIAVYISGGVSDAFMEYSDGKLEVTGPNATAQIFATYPAPYLSLINGFADQVMSTAVLLVAIFAIFDTKNNSVPKGLEPIVVGLLIIVLTCSLGMNSGCAMNPARDLGPRLFTAIAGWGMEVFTAGNNWWWVPIVAPLLGGVLGAMIYIIFIEMHHSDPHTGEENEVHTKYELSNMA